MVEYSEYFTTLKRKPLYSEDICLQTLSLLFKYSKHETIELFVSPANSSLVGILITIGDVTDIFAIPQVDWMQSRKRYWHVLDTTCNIIFCVPVSSD